ncbi:MAG: hypothetical protein J7K00_04480 [Candidatus Diapherotrites archaeon]|nr:hypothetical protein [Candidatus Diapherotrites archaeon]
MGESKEKKEIVIIEPHPDDAWLNLGGYILSHPKINFEIITCSSSPCNKSTSEKLSEIIENVKKVTFLNFVDINWVKTKRKELREKYGFKTNATYKKELLTKIFEDCNTDSKTANDLLKEVKSNITKKTEIIAPMGIKHPMHSLVSMLLEGIATKYYKEYPYFWSRENKKNYGNFESDQRISFSKDIFEKKVDIFKQIYPEQFFWLYVRGNKDHWADEELLNKK